MFWVITINTTAFIGALPVELISHSKEAEFTDVHQKKVNWIFQLSEEGVLLTAGTKMEVNKNV